MTVVPDTSALEVRRVISELINPEEIVVRKPGCSVIVTVVVGETISTVAVEMKVPTLVMVEGLPFASVVEIKLVPTLVMGTSVVDVS
jgi:hypothetical protein